VSRYRLLALVLVLALTAAGCTPVVNAWAIPGLRVNPYCTGWPDGACPEPQPCPPGTYNPGPMPGNAVVGRCLPTRALPAEAPDHAAEQGGPR
jgi:hypothetical protein